MGPTKELIHTNLFKRWSFLVIGMIATVAYRVIIFTGERWTDILWYIGTIGYIFYFAHQTEVQRKRADLVRDNNLVSTVYKLKIAKQKKDALVYLAKTVLTSKARWVSLAIVWLSVVVLVFGALYDFVI